jgi:hypothetical protein
MSGSEPSIVKTIWPELLTVPLANRDPFFFTLNKPPAGFPPIDHVMVWDASLEEWVQPYEEPPSHALNAGMVTKAVPSLFVTARFETFTVPSAIVPFTVRALNATLWFVLVNAAETRTFKLVAVRSDLRVIVPPMVSDANCCPIPSVTVWFVPMNVTEDAVDVKGLAEAEFQDPAMEIVDVSNVRTAAPVEVKSPVNTGAEPVRVKSPDHVMFDVKVVPIPELTVRLLRAWGTRIDPPVVFTTMVEVPAANMPAEVSNDLTVNVLPFAVNAPPLDTVNVFARTGRFNPEVVRVAVPEPPRIATVFATKPRVAIVKTIVEAPLSNTTPLNSLPVRLAPANAMVWSEVARNVTVADPADQEAEVETFVQFPKTVQASEPNTM